MTHVLYTLINCEQDPDALDYRLTDSDIPLLGSRAWMNPESLAPDFEVVSLRLFQGAPDHRGDRKSVCLAELSLVGRPADYPRCSSQSSPDYAESIILYWLPKSFYGCSFHWSDRGHFENEPVVGPFIEYDLQPKGESPNKQIVGFQTLYGTGAFPTRLHIAQLEPIRDRVMVAA
jgi:hypothetical protein